MVKKLLKIFLLVIYLFSCTELQELSKLPVLFQHYFEHKSLEGNITFFQYIEHHYNDIPHTDDDAERDNQLPFKTHDFCAAGNSIPALPPSLGFNIKKINFVLIKPQKTTYKVVTYHNAFSGKIWQPPKFNAFT